MAISEPQRNCTNFCLSGSNQLLKYAVLEKESFIRESGDHVAEWMVNHRIKNLVKQIWELAHKRVAPPIGFTCIQYQVTHPAGSPGVTRRASAASRGCK